MNTIVEQDLKYIFKKMNKREIDKLGNSSILITGCAGFLGFYFMKFFEKYFSALKLKRIIGIDNFILGKPKWLSDMSENKDINLDILDFDIIEDSIQNIKGAKEADIIIHLASIASPTYYRHYPIKTMDANIWGLRKILDFYKNKNLKGLLFFSSSEVYGDPIPEEIPTSEDYHGNVSTIGPRACYDEAKRFGETMCFLFNKKYGLPIRIARPFNNYGPGMNLNDKRVPADFAKNVYRKNDIIILSNGTPTRTFCYVADAIIGYLKIITYDNFDIFNIGIDKPEISIKQLAQLYIANAKKVFGYDLDIKFAQSEDKDYLVNNPLRRCPNINKAQRILNYKPEITIIEGVKKYLEYIKNCKEDEIEW